MDSVNISHILRKDHIIKQSPASCFSNHFFLKKNLHSYDIVIHVMHGMKNIKYTEGFFLEQALTHHSLKTVLNDVNCFILNMQNGLL